MTFALRSLVLTAAFALTACGEDGIADQIARDQAKDAVRPVLEQNFPGVPVEPTTDCIIDSASAGEIISLASAAVTGVNGETVETVFDILQRERTQRCLLEKALPAFF